ncbi:membrane bound O-acyl transferase family-domain-containing protein [Lyophyllum atratum]|nr:membrane bound O-acyl transferase family-domain-containing protein [Lyophyllum atratum]
MSSDEGRPPFPFLTFLVVPDILLAFALALDLSKRTRLISFVAFAWVCYEGLLYTTGDKMQDYSMGSTIGGQFFTALHLLLIVEPIRQFRHSTDVDDPRTRPLLKRVYWAGCIIHSPRGIGWNYQTPHVPDRPSMKRGSFIISRFLRVFGCFLIMDAAQTFVHTNPLFSGSPAELENATITSQGFLYRCLNSIAWMATPYAGVRLQYYLFSIISVALGLSTPADWPDPYGKWRDAYTVRNFWGRTWHQMMRRYLSSTRKVVVQAAGFKKGTWMSSNTQLLVGFFVSGVMHSFGDAMVGRKYFGASFPFFMVQVLAIIVEDTIVELADRVGRKPSAKLFNIIGFAWVFAWLMFSFPLYIDWAVKAGLGNCELLPVSPVRAALGLLNL